MGTGTWLVSLLLPLESSTHCTVCTFNFGGPVPHFEYNFFSHVVLALNRGSRDHFLYPYHDAGAITSSANSREQVLTSIFSHLTS